MGLPYGVSDVIRAVCYDVEEELESATEKHGFEQTPMNPEKSLEKSFIILAEEFGEVARALTHDEGSLSNLEDELIQTAAMAVAMVVALRADRVEQWRRVVGGWEPIGYIDESRV